MEGIENLPDDCLQSIFNYLNEGDMKIVSVVCKEFLTNTNLCKQSMKVIHPEITMLSAHLKRFRGIKKIDLTDFLGDKDKAVLEIARFGIGLEALNVSCRKGTESLKELGSNSKMKNLKVLHFRSGGRLQDNDLVLIANSFPKLEELKIGYTDYYNLRQKFVHEVSSSFPIDYGVEYLASKLKLLKKIDFSGKHIVSDRSLVALSLSCVFLKDVKIWCNDHNLTENGIGLLLRNRPNLEALSIKYMKTNPSQSTITIANSIRHAKALTSLEFLKMDISDMLLNAIAKAKLRLKKFKLMICNNFTSAGLLMVLANYQLTELRIIGDGFVVQDVNLLFNGDVSKLTNIEISPCKVTKSTLFLLSAKCPSLEEIKISYILDRHRQVLDELGFLFPNLRVLHLSLLYPITSKDIKAILKSCKFLRKLTLIEQSEAKVPEPDNSELPKVNLEDLTLSNSWIDDEGLVEIAKICPRLVYLDLSYSNRLTTEGVKQIIRIIKTLNYLCIRGRDHSGRDHINRGDLLDWMLSTGNLASLKRIYVGVYHCFSQEQIDEFFQHGCLLLRWSAVGADGMRS